jgi:N-acetylneuraminate lyase/4-hydroxy-tetrahydrodipicolinate synthase
MTTKTFEKLRGVIPPMITPFDEQGEVDEKALREVVAFLKTRVNGLFICGSYGCGPLMTPEQRKTVVEVTVDEVSGAIPVIVHVGAISTDVSVDLAKHAAAAGADRVASVPPYYYSHGPAVVKEHFRKLAEAVDIPVYVYNNPKTVGYAISPQLAAELKEVGVAGVKDSSFDIMVYSGYQVSCGPEFDVVVGTEVLFWPASVIGAQAFIPGLGNAFPETMNQLYTASMLRDCDKARELHFKSSAMRDVIHSVGPNLVGVQAALHLRGINAGLPKSPFKPLTEEAKKKLKTSMEALGVEF